MFNILFIFMDIHCSLISNELLVLKSLNRI